MRQKVCNRCTWWEAIFDDSTDTGACNNHAKVIVIDETEHEEYVECPKDGILFSTDPDYHVEVGSLFGCIHWKEKT